MAQICPNNPKSITPKRTFGTEEIYNNECKFAICKQPNHILSNITFTKYDINNDNLKQYQPESIDIQVNGNKYFTVIQLYCMN